MHRQPDILAEFTLLAQGGRKGPTYSGYRPEHAIKQDYLTTGTHKYLDKDSVMPGESAQTEIIFVTPAQYPHCLWIGKELCVQEGNLVVGAAVVLKIYNQILESPIFD